MKIERVSMLFVSCMLLLAVPAAFAQTSREDLQEKYPDIDFHWMQGAPDLQPPEGKAEASPSAASAEAPAGAPGAPPYIQPWPDASPNAEQLAEAEMVARMGQEPDMRLEELESHTITNVVERESYTLGPGDVISLNVRDHPEFSSPALAIGLGGELILPLTNEVIYAEGLTSHEVAGKIQQRLGAYIETPFVTVFIIEYNSKKYYILGEVGAGVYPIGDTSITLMDALYQAGLPYEGTSAMRRVQIITPDEDAPKNEWVNVYSILYKGRMKHNITIQPGMIIYVPSTMLTKLSGILRQLSTTTEDLASVPWDLANFDAGLIAFDRAYGHGGYTGQGIAWHAGW